MAIFKKQISVGGAWAKGSELQDIKRAVIVSEAVDQLGQFKDQKGNPKYQTVAKVRFEGIDEPLNVSLNRATKNGLIDAFGEDSNNWMNKVLSVETEKGRVSGKAVTFLYLIPEGYEKIDDDNGYAMIVKQGSKPERYIDSSSGDEIKPEDLPF